MNQFFADSLCGRGCLDDAERYRRAGPVRRAWRRVAVVSTFAVCWGFGLVSTVCPEHIARRLLWTWTSLYTRATGARVKISGKPDVPGPALVTANHVSSLDAMFLLAARRFVVVAHEELADDPFLGRLAANAGMIFIRKGSLGGVRGLVAAITAELERGNSVLVFPEGHIRCLPPGGRFSPSALQAAINAGVPVRPLAIWWELGDGHVTSRASWLGSESLWQSLRRVLDTRGLTFRAEELPEIAPAGAAGRAELARRAQQAITTAAPEVPGACAANRPSVSAEVSS